MARFGSEKIRGHGIPEALEAILFGRSKMDLKVAATEEYCFEGFRIPVSPYFFRPKSGQSGHCYASDDRNRGNDISKVMRFVEDLIE